MVKRLFDYKMADLFRHLLFICLVGCLAACSDEEPKPEEPDVPDEASGYFESVGETKTYTAQKLIETAFDLGEGEQLPISSNVEVRVEVINYHTVNPKGEPVVASGIISYPLTGSRDKTVLAERFTISKGSEAPSEKMASMESALSLFECLVVSPDLIGFGATEKLPHPYLHAENTAQVSIDMLFAVREYFASKEEPLSPEIYIVGYSQGGAASLAVQKMIEEKYISDIEIVQTMAGGGPYDLTGMFDEVVKNDYTGYPCSIPLTVIGMDYGDNLDLDYSQILIDPLLSNYDEWVNSKQYTTGSINEKIGTRKVSEIMHPDMFTKEKNSHLNKFYASLKKNSLIDWTPKAPIMLVHGTKDDVVPFFCSENACNSFKERGAKVELISVNYGHKDAALPFYLRVLAILTN